MPILSIETYFSQFFWLFVILFIFNDFILHKYIPGIAKIMKARKETSTYQSEKVEKSNINIILPVFTLDSSNKINNFNDTRVNWINKQNK